LIDESDDIVEFAIQGPKAQELIQNFTIFDYLHFMPNLYADNV